MRSALTTVVLALAAVVLAGMAFVSYGLTSEYGAAPNGGGLGEAVLGVLGAAPAAAVVGLLLAVAARRSPRRRQVVLLAAGALVGLLVVAVGTLLGQLALNDRCEDRRTISAACPRPGRWL